MREKLPNLRKKKQEKQTCLEAKLAYYEYCLYGLKCLKLLLSLVKSSY